MKILNHELEKLELKTAKTEDIPKIEVPKYTLEDYKRDRIEMIRRFNEDIKELRRIFNEAAKKYKQGVK